jgi:hypothetical protein
VAWYSLVLSVALATREFVTLLPTSHTAIQAEGALFPPKNCVVRAFPTLHTTAGGTSNSLFGDDLYAYPLGKHNRPPLKL